MDHLHHKQQNQNSALQSYHIQLSMVVEIKQHIRERALTNIPILNDAGAQNISSKEEAEALARIFGQKCQVDDPIIAVDYTIFSTIHSFSDNEAVHIANRIKPGQYLVANKICATQVPGNPIFTFSGTAITESCAINIQERNGILSI